MVIVERLPKAHCRRNVLGILAKVQIIPPRGVLQKIDHSHRIGGFPSIFEPHLGSQPTHWVL